MARPFRFFFPKLERGCPVLTFFARAGHDTDCAMFVMPKRPASHLRRPPPALYNLFLLSAIAVFANRAQSRPLPLGIGADSRALSHRRRRLRGHAGTHPPLITEPEVGTPTVMQVLKQRTARALLPKKTRPDRHQMPSIRRCDSTRAFLAGSLL